MENTYIFNCHCEGYSIGAADGAAGEEARGGGAGTTR